MLEPLPKDSGHNVIQSCSAIKIFTISTTDENWTPVTLPCSTKVLLLRLRSGDDFKLSTSPTGEEYFTATGFVGLSLAMSAGKTPFYVQTIGDDVLEVIALY